MHVNHGQNPKINMSIEFSVQGFPKRSLFCVFRSLLCVVETECCRLVRRANGLLAAQAASGPRPLSDTRPATTQHARKKRGSTQRHTERTKEDTGNTGGREKCVSLFPLTRPSCPCLVLLPLPLLPCPLLSALLAHPTRLNDANEGVHIPCRHFSPCLFACCSALLLCLLVSPLLPSLLLSVAAPPLSLLLQCSVHHPQRLKGNIEGECREGRNTTERCRRVFGMRQSEGEEAGVRNSSSPSGPAEAAAVRSPVHFPCPGSTKLYDSTVVSYAVLSCFPPPPQLSPALRIASRPVCPVSASPPLPVGPNLLLPDFVRCLHLTRRENRRRALGWAQTSTKRLWGHDLRRANQQRGYLACMHLHQPAMPWCSATRVLSFSAPRSQHSL